MRKMFKYFCVAALVSVGCQNANAAYLLLNAPRGDVARYLRANFWFAAAGLYILYLAPGWGFLILDGETVEDNLTKLEDAARATRPELTADEAREQAIDAYNDAVERARTTGEAVIIQFQ